MHHSQFPVIFFRQRTMHRHALRRLTAFADPRSLNGFCRRALTMAFTQQQKAQIETGPDATTWPTRFKPSATPPHAITRE
jgi:hypothetical protein